MRVLAWLLAALIALQGLQSVLHDLSHQAKPPAEGWADSAPRQHDAHCLLCPLLAQPGHGILAAPPEWRAPPLAFARPEAVSCAAAPSHPVARRSRDPPAFPSVA